MTLGEVLLSSLSSGVITQDEVDWVTSHQHCFSREEVASALHCSDSGGCDPLEVARK